MPSNADQNLLIGMLALQMGFVDRDAIISAMQAWTFDRSKSVGQILVEQGRLSEEKFSLLKPFIVDPVTQDADLLKSTALVESICTIRRDLEALNDRELTESLAGILRLPAEVEPSTVVDRVAHGVEASRFEIVRPYARGGLGEVYIARDLELNREVALKEIRDHVAEDPNNRARFVWEAEVTGRLEHPGIVPVYGMGKHPDGRPFYAMRLVHGETLKHAIERFHGASVGDTDSPTTITSDNTTPFERRPPRLLSSHSLTFRELLSRFIAVCNAVGYAHSRGVLHRDLKPSNIILGRFGETLVVDWGLAKAIGKKDVPSSGDQTSTSILGSPDSVWGDTLAGSPMGTPVFMSPEQASHRVEDLGPATDVYGLGATLYCLLTGRPPFEHGHLREMLQKVDRGEFVRPRAVQPKLPAALEAICLQAMARDPRQRYPSAKALASDVEHWLADETVSAWHEPVVARTLRWARRHPTLVASAAVLLLVATVSLAVGAVLVGREQARTQRAESEVRSAELMASAKARTAQEVAEFLIDMFAAPVPYEFLGMQIRLGTNEVAAASRVLLERGAQQLSERLDDQPVLKAALLAAIARAHTGTGSFEQAAPLLEQALSLRRHELPANDRQIAENLLQLSQVYFLQGRSAEAQQLARENLAIRRTLFEESHDDVTSGKAHLAFVLGLPGDGVVEAERLWRDVLKVQRGTLEANDSRLAETLVGLSGVLLWGPEVGSTFRPLEAAPLLNEAINIFKSHESTRGVGLAIAGFQRAIVARRLGSAQRGAEAYKDAYQLMRGALGEDHPLTIYVMHDYAECLFDGGLHDQAREVYGTIFAFHQEHGMPFVTAIIEQAALSRFATLLKEVNERDRLEPIFRRVLAKQKRQTRYRSQNDAFVFIQLVTILRDEHREQEARAVVDDYLMTSNVLSELNIVGNVLQRDAIVALLSNVGRTEEAKVVAEKSLATSSSRDRLPTPSP